MMKKSEPRSSNSSTPCRTRISGWLAKMVFLQGLRSVYRLSNGVALAFEDSSSEVLLRIEIPDTDRLPCLRALNRMNINHLSLFPDLTGASRATNLKLELQ